MIIPAKRVNEIQEYYFSRKLKEVAQLNAKGENIKPESYDIAFKNVDFSYSNAVSTENRKVLIIQKAFTRAVPPDGITSLQP